MVKARAKTEATDVFKVKIKLEISLFWKRSKLLKSRSLPSSKLKLSTRKKDIKNKLDLKKW